MEKYVEEDENLSNMQWGFKSILAFWGFDCGVDRLQREEMRKAMEEMRVEENLRDRIMEIYATTK